MTKTTIRSVAQITVAIAVCDKFIADCEAFLQELRNESTTNGAECLIGYPQYGFYLNPTNKLGGLLFAKRYDVHAAVRMPKVTNGKGEVAEIVTYGLAVNKAISQQEAFLSTMWGQRRELCDELAAAVVAADVAKMERELARHRRAVAVALDYFDDRADADCDEDGFVANPELRASSEMRAWLDGSMGH
jgi:hypothetical protein